MRLYVIYHRPSSRLGLVKLWPADGMRSSTGFSADRRSLERIRKISLFSALRVYRILLSDYLHFWFHRRLVLFSILNNAKMITSLFLCSLTESFHSAMLLLLSVLLELYGSHMSTLSLTVFNSQTISLIVTVRRSDKEGSPSTCLVGKTAICRLSKLYLCFF